MRILSWNIQWGRGMDGRVDLARIAAQSLAKSPDLLCLQEVARFHPDLPGGADEDQVAHLARLFPGFEPVYGAGSDLADGRGGRRQFGNLILSRYPVLQAFRHLLPWPADPVVPSMQRAAVEAVIDSPIGPCRLISTHLEYYSQRQRMAQVDALRALHAEAHRHALQGRVAQDADAPFAPMPRGEYAVICGDFNSPAGSMEYRRMQEAIAPDVPALVDTWRIAHPGSDNDATVGIAPVDWVSGPSCFDFCFVGANLAGRVREISVDRHTRASDHQPVLLELGDRRDEAHRAAG